jgi:hypothetical protein
MKLVKYFVLPVVFVSVLAVNSYAGEIETPGFLPPPPDRSMSYVNTANETCPVTETSENSVEPSDKFFYDAIMTMLSLV